MKVLLLDIELAPALVHAWGLRDQNIGINQIMQPGYLLCWAAKWYGVKELQFGSVHAEPKRMLRRIHKLLDEADVVVSYNGKRFDLPHLNREFVTAGMAPPSPYKQVDLLHTARQQFRFASNKLDYVAQQLGLGSKVKHSGHDLWVRCMANDPKAWAEMEKYNRHDVLLLELLYDRLMPWVKLHPNHGLYDEPGVPVCANCGSARLQRRGFARTQVQKYARYQCTGCGAWMRDAAGELPKADRQVILRRDQG